MPNPVAILLVEDNPDDAALTEWALRGGVPANVEIARDGQEALDYLFNDFNDLPRLVLLDLRLPSIDGFEVLRRIREHERTSLIPIVVLTSSSAPDDVAAAIGTGPTATSSSRSTLSSSPRWSVRSAHTGSWPTHRHRIATTSNLRIPGLGCHRSVRSALRRRHT